MGWTIQMDDHRGIIEVRAEGAFTTAVMKAITSQAIARANAAGVRRFLVDLSEIMMIAPLYEILDLPVSQYPRERLDRRSRIALIRPQDPEARRAVYLFQAVCLHYRWSVRLFEDRPEAIAFLQNPGDALVRPWFPTDTASTP